MRALGMAGAAALTLALVACGGDDDGEPPIVQPDVDASDYAADNYETAYTVCGSFPIEETAEEYDAASQDPVDVATAFAEGYRPAYRQPVFAGCLDALLGEPKDPPTR